MSGPQAPNEGSPCCAVIRSILRLPEDNLERFMAHDNSIVVSVC